MMRSSMQNSRFLRSSRLVERSGLCSRLKTCTLRQHAVPGQEKDTASTSPESRTPESPPSSSSTTGTYLSPPIPIERPPEVEAQAVLTVGFLAAVAFICSIDRAAMSLCILPMSSELGFTDVQKGAISSSFFLGYTFTNAIAGLLASSLSPKTVMASGVVAWSLFTILTPLAARSGNVNLLIATRFLMGIGEGITYPTIQEVARRWIPQDRRSTAITRIYSGAGLGTTTSLLLAPLVIQQFGWDSVFYLFGSLGFFWALGWQPRAKDTPQEILDELEERRRSASPSSTTSTSDSDAKATWEGSRAASSAAASTSQPVPKEREVIKPLKALNLREIPWGDFAREPALWAIFAAHTTWAWAHYELLAWLPTFYAQNYGADIRESAALTVVPWVTTFLITNIAGLTADTIVRKGWLDRTNTRKLMNSVSSLIPAACLFYLGSEAGKNMDQNSALLVFTITLAFSAFNGAGFGTNHQDLSSKYAALLFGITNACCSISGTVSVYAAGEILQRTHSWDLVWLSSASLLVAGNLIYVLYAKGYKVFV